jgi:hypothetical protein
MYFFSAFNRSTSHKNPPTIFNWPGDALLKGYDKVDINYSLFFHLHFARSPLPCT